MEGSICLRNDGRYMARFYENGRQKCFYGKTKKEAVEKLKKALNEKKKAEKEKKEKSCYLTIKFSDFSQDFLEIFKKPILKKSTFHSINNKLKRFSQENLYKMKMRNITYFDLNNFYEKIDINYTTYLLFKEIFEKAKEMGIIEINPFCLVVKPKNLEQNEKNNYNSTENKQIKDSCILSNEEINQILNFDYKEKQINVCLKLLYLTGLRISEALALTVKDISFEKKEIYVTKQLGIYIKEISSPKTKKSVRKVPLFDSTIELLKEYIATLDRSNLFDFNYHKLDYKLKMISNIIGRKVKTHMFRKTFISRMQFDYGISADIVAEWAGHDSIVTTKKSYTFLTNSAKENAINFVNNNFQF